MKDIPMCFEGFVSLNNNKRIIPFDECLVCLNSFYNKTILILIIPILQMRKVAQRELAPGPYEQSRIGVQVCSAQKSMFFMLRQVASRI